MLVVAAFHLARQLRQRHDRNVEFLRQGFELGGDLGDFLHAVFLAAARRARQQLQIVDDQQIEAALALEPARAGGKLRHRKAAGLVDVERQVLQFDRVILDLLEIGLADGAAPDLVGWNAGLFGDDTGGQLLGRHFEREEADDAAVDGDGMAVGLYFAAPGAGDVVADIGGERGLAHAGTAGDDDQVGRLQAPHHAVEIVEPGGDAG